MDNLKYEITIMKALPAYELFCELGNSIGQQFLGIVLQKDISIHFFVIQECQNPAKVKAVMKKLFDATFKHVTINDVLYLQDDLPLKVWCNMIDIALKEQFGDFFLDLEKSFTALNATK